MAQEAAIQLKITTAAAEAYLHRVHYRIEEAEKKGQALFQQALKQHGYSFVPSTGERLRHTGS